jgi:hypothetical protein
MCQGVSGHGQLLRTDASLWQSEERAPLQAALRQACSCPPARAGSCRLWRGATRRPGAVEITGQWSSAGLTVGGGFAAPSWSGDQAKVYAPVSAYLYKRSRWMRFQSYRRHLWPIGSETTEVACKIVFTQRLKRSGMSWTISGGQGILELCVIW